MEGYMEDAQGRMVPENLVSDIDKLRNSVVLGIIEKAKAMSEALARFKAGLMDDIQAFVDISGERFDVKMGGTKGNVQLTSFDGRYKVLRAVAEYLTFDERLQVAKALIDECIHEWTKTSGDEIKALVNDAFYVDKLGRINTGRILGLRRLAIENEKWQEAMRAISESLQVAGSKSYVRVYERQADGGYRQINLDIAAL